MATDPPAGLQCTHCCRVNTAKTKFCNYCGVKQGAAVAESSRRRSVWGGLRDGDESASDKAEDADLKAEPKIEEQTLPVPLPVRKRLRIKIISAKGLRAMDFGFFGGTSDPFCACQIQGKPETEVRTKTIKKTLHPEWNEEHDISHYMDGDNLEFTVMDFNKASAHDLLGRATLPGTAFQNGYGFDGILDLADCGKGRAAILRVQVRIIELPPPGPPVSQQGSRLSVSVVSATGLRAADWILSGGKSDPFCAFEILGKPETKVETRYIPKTLNPVWSEEHELPAYERGEDLSFAVYDYDRGSAPDFLGTANLSSSEFDFAGGFEGELRLAESGRTPPAKLKVKVQVLPPLQPDAPLVSRPGSRLKVAILGARGLRAADWSLVGGSTSDPVCCCEVQGKPETKFETRRVNKTLQPSWNEEHEIPTYERGDSLQFQVYDYDKASAPDFLGRATLAAREFDREGGFLGELKLFDSGKGSQAFLAIRVEVALPLWGEDAPSLSQAGSRLSITVLSATGLRGVHRSLDGSSTSDPFCVCEVEGRPAAKFETRHIANSMAPEWHEEHEVDYGHGEHLQFQVLDYGRGHSHELLGRTALPCNAFDREGGFSGELSLTNCGGGFAAKLKVHVAVLPPLFTDAPAVSEPGSILRVTVIKATFLRAADWSLIGKASSDPYCVCQVPGKPATKFQTRHISKCLDPVWNEDHEVEDYERGDDLDFVVFDYDRGSSDDLLGKFTLPCGAFDRDGGFEGDLRLRESGKGQAASLTVRVEIVSPRLLPQVSPVSVPGSRLRVVTLRASGLRCADAHILGGKANAYCVCRVKGKSEDMRQTKHIPKTVDPVWNEEHEFEAFDRGDYLEFSVYDHDRGSAADLLGTVVLASSDFDRDGGFSGELNLRKCGAGHRATLAVEVEVLPPLLLRAPPISVPGSKLKVMVTGAKGLQAADRSLLGHGKSDPFCVCEIKGKPGSKFRTKHTPKTLQPMWNEEHEFDDYTLGDDLQFEVFDYDTASAADFLGRATLRGSAFDREGGFHGELSLRECGTAKEAALILGVDVILPELAAGSIWRPGSRLRVSILRANRLRAADGGPERAALTALCRCEIRGRPETRIETKPLAKVLDPVWDEEHHILDFSPGESLDFSVWDHSQISAALPLGRISLASRDFDREEGFEGTLNLHDGGAGAPATLTVGVCVLPPLVSTDRISEPGCTLRITIFAAQGLSSHVGKPNSFCICCLRGKSTTETRTRSIEGTSSPSWDEEMNISGYEQGDRLQLAVMEHHAGKEADVLGKASLEGPQFDCEGGYEGEVRLHSGREGQLATLRLRVQVLLPAKQAIVVSLFRASCIPQGHELPRLSCACCPVGRPRARVETRAISPTSEVVWDEELEVAGYVQGDALEFQLFGDALATEPARSLLGTAHVACSAVDLEEGLRREAPLLAAGGGAVAVLQLRVESAERCAARRLVEAEERSAREEKARERARVAELRRQEVEEKERKKLRKLQEEAEERERKLEVKKAAERARQRAEELQGEVAIRVLLWPTGEVLATISAARRDTVLELARCVARSAKLPLCPQIRIGEVVAAEASSLWEVGACDGRAQVFAEACTAVLTASADCTARVWNATKGHCELIVRGHDAAVNTAAATQDLRWLATASDDCTAKVWAIDGGMRTAVLAWTLEGHEQAVHAAVFSQDGGLVATASADRTARIWKMKTGQCMRVFDGHLDAVLSATFTADGKSIKTTTRDRLCKTWSVDSGRCTGKALGQDPARPSSSTPDGKLRLNVALGTEIEIESTATSECLHVLKGHASEILWASFILLRAPHISSRTFNAEQLYSSRNLSHSFSAGATLILNRTQPLGSPVVTKKQDGRYQVKGFMEADSKNFDARVGARTASLPSLTRKRHT